MTSPIIHRTDVADSPEHRAILAGLKSYNQAHVGAYARKLVVLALKDAAGEVTAGLSAYTGLGWLFIELLWVSDGLRGQDVGTRLMDEAERIAREEHGCKHAWLDTFEFQARGFYEKRGYAVFGELADYPSGHARYFMKKSLG